MLSSILFDPPRAPAAIAVAWLVLCLYAISIISIFLAEWRTRKADPSLRTRYLSSVVLGAVVLIPAYLGGIWFAMLVAVINLLCLREFFNLVHVWETSAYKWIGRVAAVAFPAVAFFESTPVKPLLKLLGAQSAHAAVDTSLTSALHALHPFYVLPVFIIMAVLLVPIAMQRYQGMSVRESFTIFGILYFGWFLSHLVLIRNEPHGFPLVILLLLAVVFNDVFAYTFGRLFGHTAVAPIISPKKTREGTAAGLLGSLGAALIAPAIMAELSQGLAIGAGLIIGLAAPVGDLVVSVVKRDMGVKDSGHLIPGHGGLLDRCDSFTFAAPAFYYYLRLFGLFSA